MQVVGSVLYGADDLVATMVASRIAHVGGAGFGPCTALGVVRSGTLLGGVVFHNYRPQARIIEMSGAFDRADWARPSTLRRLFAYPFIDLACQNLVTFTGRKNKRARRIDEGLGFKLVGIIHRAIDGREDACLYQMPRDECRWLKGKDDGQKFAGRTSDT